MKNDEKIISDRAMGDNVIVHIKVEPKFYSSGSSDEHEESHDPSEILAAVACFELTYCSTCGKREPLMFSKKDAQCDVCQTNLEYQCARCFKVYKRVKSLRFHQRHDCNKDPSFQCEYCDYKTTRKASLQTHVKCKHSDLKSKHKCSKCGRRYKHRFHMLGHEKHCGQALIKCELCEFMTNRPENLKLHIRNIHADPDTIDMYACAECGRTYKHSKSYHKHKTVCGKDIRIKCAHCDFYTNSKFTLLVHLSQNHKEEVFPLGRPTGRAGKGRPRKHTD